ncbi:uncharacterized protein LOC101852766 [Aplysia californica]|uniref:Uncharacterized protein LOC101852766 n=1 Tax=Aplysia californica TaxID=6500 RepID=A0ABM0JNP5_APLCA|nr:uncharacterized protein LOC101852766 [Aplysia californica]
MADEHSDAVEPGLEFDGQVEENSDLNPERFIFQKEYLPDNAIPDGAQAMQSLVTSVPSSVFSLEDITSSTTTGVNVITSIAGDSATVLKGDAGSAQGFTLMEGEGGEFMVVATNPEVGSLEDSEGALPHVGNTITLNLDEATQFLLRQQGITQAVQLADGSFQIIDNSVMQVEREDGSVEGQALPIEMLQALQGELSHSLTGGDGSFSAAEALAHLDSRQGDSDLKLEPDGHEEMKPVLENPEDESVTLTVSNPVIHETAHSLEDVSEDKVREMVEEREDEDDNSNGATVVVNSDMEQTLMKPEEKRSSVKKELVVEKEPDLTNPIPLSEQTVITVKGKKCVLAFNQDTQQVCAYPLKPAPGTKRRGRPRLSEEEKQKLMEKKRQQQQAQMEKLQQSGSEQNSAAETLLELSNTGTDGVRRSGRKRRKAKLLEEYEELEDSDEEEPFTDNQDKDPDITLNLPDFKKKKTAQREAEPPTMILTAAPAAAPPPVKRGRGRPRRYPPPGQPPSSTSIPAVMIPSANGQTTLLMTPVQGFHNLPNFRPTLPIKPAEDTTRTVTATAVVTSTSGAGDAADASSLSLANDTDSLPLDTSGVLDSNSIIPSALQGDTIPIVGDNTDTSDNVITMDTPASMMNFTATTSTSDKTKDTTTAGGADSSAQPTVIQIPDSLLPMLGIKKDPIKIGLKASERELEKLKCPKCDFQGYYSQQYRNHIATHGDDIQKCKCCSFISLDSEELLAHFKEFHPRCICPECDYMAEHAYIIKRHMMRHDTKSCTCNICGKVYKDMYILKMHVKMVHMPAEVLFECNICTKKFTRKAHLKRHLRIHDPEKPFKCLICDYRGCERSDISKHMLIHEEPKHACERCGKTFRHIKNKELHVKRHYGQRDYKCGVCDFFGYTFTDIRKHIERKHQDIKMLICDKCNKHFRSEYALKEHQATCNVMMIEQVLAIPTSSGGTSQATIQIPANLGPEQQIILDGQAISVDGQAISVNKHGGLNIMVTEQHLGLAGGTTEEEEEEDAEEEEEAGMGRTMHIIGDTIMTESGQEMQILPQQSLTTATRIISQADLQQIIASQAAADAVHQSEAVSVATSEGTISQVLVSATAHLDHGATGHLDPGATGHLDPGATSHLDPDSAGHLDPNSDQVAQQFINPETEEEEGEVVKQAMVSPSQELQHELNIGEESGHEIVQETDLKCENDGDS